MPLGFQVGVEHPRRLGPRGAAGVGSASHCGQQFRRRSRPDTFPESEPLDQFAIKGIIEFRQCDGTQRASIPIQPCSRSFNLEGNIRGGTHTAAEWRLRCRLTKRQTPISGEMLGQCCHCHLLWPKLCPCPRLVAGRRKRGQSRRFLGNVRLGFQR